jgi:3-methyladenine DNA glycosylase AlkD
LMKVNKHACSMIMTNHMSLDEILSRLRSLANPEAVAGMARFGINPKNTYGISIPALRKIARELGTNHDLAQQLWASGVHEAKILAAMVDDHEKVTEGQLESWVEAFDSWDVCDQCCSNLFDETRFAYQKAVEWSSRKEEFVKRAGYALMAALAVHDKSAPDTKFLRFLPLIRRGSSDERNFVKKAVNWALRQIGKRNRRLNRAAIATAKEIQAMESKTARWIAADALRELTSPAVQKKVHQVGRR